MCQSVCFSTVLFNKTADKRENSLKFYSTEIPMKYTDGMYFEHQNMYMREVFLLIGVVD